MQPLHIPKDYWIWLGPSWGWVQDRLLLRSAVPLLLLL
jgi:hypothetical protein